MKKSIIGMLVSIRDIGKICFLIIRNNIGEYQVVLKDKDLKSVVSDLYIGSTIRITGEEKPTNSICLSEFSDPSIEVVSANKNVPIIDYSKSVNVEDIDTLFNNRALSLRTKESIKMMSAVSEMTAKYFEYMHSKNAKYFISPHFSGSGTEGGAEIFKVAYFDNEAYLTQSAQTFKQIMVGSLMRVFSISPFFRADPSHTSRHLSEANQLEFETIIDGDWTEVIDIMLGFLAEASTIFQKYFGDDALKFSISDHSRLTFTEAKSILKTLDVPMKDGDLSAVEEEAICNYLYDKYGHKVVVITHWPEDSRPFYSFCDGKGFTHTFDILCNGIEVCSGGQRINEEDKLISSMKKFNINPSSMKTYVDAFKYGMPPHGGFGAGLERIALAFSGKQNIKHAVPFPSDSKMIASDRIAIKTFFGGEAIRDEAFRLMQGSLSSDKDGAISVKSLIVKGKDDKNILIVVPVDKRLDMKSVKEHLGFRVSFEDSKIILDRYGLVVGDIPPFGNIFGVKMILDSSIMDYPKISFSTGKIGEEATCLLDTFKNIFKFSTFSITG